MTKMTKMTRMTRMTAGIVAIMAAAVVSGCQTEDPVAVPGDPQAPFQESVMGANATVGPIKLISVHIEAPTDVRYQEGDDARLWFTVYNEGRRADVLRSVQSPYANAGEIRWDADCDGNATAVPALTFQPVEPNPAASRLGVPPFDAYHVQLVGLNRAVPAGTTIPVIFTFEDAGSVTVDAAVQPSTAVRPEPSNRCHEGPSVAPLAS